MRSLFAFILLFYIVDCKQFRSDYHFLPKANGWLKLHSIPATFHDAWLRCHLEGAVLASPSNIFIELAMQILMKSGHVYKGGVFTGIHATFSKGVFFSVEGTPLDNMQLEWAPVEPDNKNNEEDCILYNANGTIADISCSERYPYFCFKKNNQNIFVTGCGTIDKEYNLDTRTGNCYKFHTNARNWSLAFMTCAAEGGHLAIINNTTEANVLIELFEKNPTDTIKYTNLEVLKDLVFIGTQDLRKQGIWTTIHGTSLVDAGYDIWSSGQPNNLTPGQYCGGMSRNGDMNDLWCDQRTPFICEKNPESLQIESNPELFSMPVENN